MFLSKQFATAADAALASKKAFHGVMSTGLYCGVATASCRRRPKGCVYASSCALPREQGNCLESCGLLSARLLAENLIAATLNDLLVLFNSL